MAIAEPTLQHRPPDAERDMASPATTDTAWRIERLVAGFRLLIALGLLLAAVYRREPALLDLRYPLLFSAVALAYVVFAAATLTVRWRQGITTTRATAMQLFGDIVAITLLTHTGGGISSGIGGVLVIFAGSASLSLAPRYAMFAAAVAALAVLGEQALAFYQGLSPVNAFVPAGVLGAIIFLTTATASPLARRLQETEALARQRGIDLANLAQLNEYVIQNLRESIVVVDEQDRIRLINQSAADLLGAGPHEPGQRLADASPDLHRMLRSWRRGHAGPDSTLGFPSVGTTTQVNTYFAPLEGRTDGPVLLFLEDASTLAEKVRQTKLAALGRLSASIAHEIRNPVGALSHAGQLLRESPVIGEQEQRLLDIINVNSQRVSEIVENVMQLSRRDSTRPERIDLGTWLNGFLQEFRSTLELDARELRVMTDDVTLEVRMDPSHLRQVCWNICENALQYANGDSEGPLLKIRYGRLTTHRRPFLEFADSGPGIDATMRERLFEPFATGRAGGTGLGLFISRELCECNRAALLYEPHPDGGSLFRIVFSDPQRWGTRT